MTKYTKWWGNIKSQHSIQTPRNPFLSRTFASVIESRNYRFVWIGNWTEHLGEWMELAAVLWLMYDMTHSPLMLTLMEALRGFPQAVFSFMGGVVADRVNRRNVLIAALLASACTSIVLAILVHTGRVQVWHLLVIAPIYGIMTSFNHPARQSIVPNTVSREHYLNAVTLDNGAALASRVLAGPATGFIIAAAGSSAIFGVRALGALLAIPWLLQVKVPPTPPEARRRAPLHSLVEGMSFVRRNRPLLAQVILSFFPHLVNSSYNSLLPVFATDVLHVGPQGYGFMQAAPGAGSLLAIFSVASLGNFRQKGKLLLTTAMLMGIFLIGFALSQWFPLSLFLLVCIGGAFSTTTTTNNAIIQELVTDSMRGRVMALREVPFGIGPGGAILTGGLAGLVGAPMALGTVALLPLLAVGAVICVVPGVRDTS